MNDLIASIISSANSTYNDMRIKIPATIMDTRNSIIIYAELSGVKRDSIKIEPNRDILKISATREPVPSTYTEIQYGRLSRDIRLPICVTHSDTVKIDSYVDGILKIVIDKTRENTEPIVLQL